MDPFAVSHFSDDALLHNLKLLNTHDCKTTAVMLTRIAEVKERKLFRREGYPSMHSYCVHELHVSEGMAYKRIQVARAARQFPAVLLAVAEGRLHVCAALMLAPYLTSGNSDELVASATHRTRFELERLVAERFPKPDSPEWIQVIPAAPSLTAGPAAAGTVEPIRTGSNSLTIPEQSDPAQVQALEQFAVGAPPQLDPACASDPVCLVASERFEAPMQRGRVVPLSPQRYRYQFTFDQQAHGLFESVGREAPSGELAQVFEGALELAKAELEKRKFAATSCPRTARPSVSPRHIPAEVKRAVRKRDGEQCSFTSDSGKRCPARSSLEFDHIEPVALGGQATAENLRLRCRVHNMYEAERAFGAEFMDRKRREAKERAKRG